MNKLKRYGRAVFFGLLVSLFAFWLAGLFSWQPLNRSVASPAGPPFEYKGALHAHTTFSDGGRSLREVASVADRLGLDFLVITDHNTLEGLDLEGSLGRCRILVGSEISTEEGHIIGLGIPQTQYRLGGSGAQSVSDVRALGGMAVIAHPVNSRNGWTAAPWVRADGFEVLNGDSVLRNAAAWKVLLGIPAFLLNPRRAMLLVMDDAQDRAGPLGRLSRTRAHDWLVGSGFTRQDSSRVVGFALP